MWSVFFDFCFLEKLTTWKFELPNDILNISSSCILSDSTLLKAIRSKVVSVINSDRNNNEVFAAYLYDYVRNSLLSSLLPLKKNWPPYFRPGFFPTPETFGRLLRQLVKSGFERERGATCCFIAIVWTLPWSVVLSLYMRWLYSLCLRAAVGNTVSHTSK